MMMKINISKKYLISILVIILLFVNSCNLNQSDSQKNSETTGRLTIVNQSTNALDFVSWTSDKGTKYFFSNDIVFDNDLGKEIEGLTVNGSHTKVVETGAAPLHFFFAAGGVMWETEELIKVDGGEDIIFTITDDTLIK